MNREEITQRQRRKLLIQAWASANRDRNQTHQERWLHALKAGLKVTPSEGIVYAHGRPPAGRRAAFAHIVRVQASLEDVTITQWFCSRTTNSEVIVRSKRLADLGLPLCGRCAFAAGMTEIKEPR